ncbi:MAG: thioredoxin domain-containing protein, partial [Anaerolineae bacterium]|nr:thioredoxin domain-containing protein [Anaerolineae bacterium]
MFTRVWKFTALLLAVVVFVSGCQPTATPSPIPTPTVAPTEVTEQTETEPTGPVEIVPPTEQAVCEVISEAVEPSAVTEKDWVEGASEEDAELTIIEFADFQCPGCAGMAPVMTAFLEAHPEARLVYRHFPLSFHDKAELTAEAAEAAGAQGKFWEMYDLLYTRASEWNGLSVEEARTKMSEYATELELDVKQFDTELDED